MVSTNPQAAGRSRNFHLGFFKNDRLNECSFGARDLYLCLNCHTDRNDVLKIDDSQIASVFLPSLSINRAGMVSELVEAGLACRTESGRLKMLNVGESFQATPPREYSHDHAANRRAIKRQAMPRWACRKAISAIYQEARKLMIQTGQAWHVDHVIPLQHEKVCGLHVSANLKVIPADENIKKSNRYEVA